MVCKINILTEIARRNVAQPLLQALVLLAEARRVRIVDVAVECVLGQLKVIRLDAVHLAGMIVPDGQRAAKRFAVNSELLVLGDVLREHGAIVGTTQRIADRVADEG